MITYILIGTIALLLVYMIVIYNSFIRLTNKVKEAFATMDVFLKKRWDLIPNIVSSVKGYAQHEKEAFENITKLRTGSYDGMTQSDKIETNEKLTAGISKLMVVAESYPDLKANQIFLDLSKQLSKVEDDIAFARKYYNAVVKNMNNAVEMFPSNIIASIFGFKQMKMYEAFQSEREVVSIQI